MQRTIAVQALLARPPRAKPPKRPKKPQAHQDLGPPQARPQTHQPPPDPLRAALLAERVPPSLTDKLLATHLTRPSLQRALTHWTGMCHLTGLMLSDSAEMLMPVQRADGQFVCRAAATLAGELSDTALVQICTLVVRHATSHPASQHPQAVPNPGTTPPATTLHHEEHPHVQEPAVGLHDQVERTQDDHWPHDAPGAAGSGNAGRTSVGDAIDQWLSRFDAGEPLPAAGGN